MPTARKIQNIETPESHVPEIEVRWLADTPQYRYRPGEIVKLPRGDELTQLILMGWVKEILV